MLATAFAVLPHPAQAQPSGAQAVAGQATLHQQGNRLLVTTQNAPGAQHSTINWQSFNVPAGSTTWFQQPSATSTSINRVVAPNPTTLLGTLGSNGHLVLVNPNGIAVGAGAVVDTARFTAAAMHMSDADALAGRLRFEGGSGVQVWGQVLARDGDVLMLAPDVQVQPGALVQAPHGAVLLAAGHKVEVVAPGLDGLRFEIQAPTDQAVNLGQLKGNAVGMFASSLRHSGQIDVEAVNGEGGSLVLTAVNQADIDGVSRTQRLDRLGGLFHATAKTLNVGSTARIDASGANGGGEVLLGGGWQGKDARLANAQTTTVARGAHIDASATAHGQGGTVVAWADGHTTFQGQITARGGEQGGDGGQVETSGKQGLDARGARVDTRAPHGRTGEWLLDPTTITIEGGCALPPCPPAPALGPAPAPAATIYEADLEAATSNIHLVADEAITVAGTFGGNAITLGSNIDIKLETVGSTAGSGINLVVAGPVPQPIAIETSGSGSIELRTAGESQHIVASTLATLGGNITLHAGGQVTVNNAHIESNDGDITIEGGSLSLYSGSGVYIHSGSQILGGKGNVTIKGASYAEPGVKIESAASPAPATVVSGAGVTITGTTGMGATSLHLKNAQVNATQSLRLATTDAELLLEASSLQNTGTGLIELKASGTTAPKLTVDADSQISNSGGTSDIHITADQVQINGSVNAGTLARVVVRADSLSRPISLGGTDETNTLNLTQDEVNKITARTLVVGWGDHIGGIALDSALTLAPAALPALSLIQAPKGSAGITQGAGAALSVTALNADASAVTLNAANTIANISGRAHLGNWALTTAADTEVGTVDGISGLQASAATSNIQLDIGGNLTQANTSAISAGNQITLQTPSTGKTATLADVSAQRLVFKGWDQLKLTGSTAFKQFSFPGGKVAVVGGALEPGGASQVVTATLDVGACQEFCV